jgi:hypothetical protein
MTAPPPSLHGAHYFERAISPTKYLTHFPPSNFRRLLLKMLEDEDHELTDNDKLTILMERVRDELADNGPFARRGWEMGELAFGRICIVAQA